MYYNESERLINESARLIGGIQKGCARIVLMFMGLGAIIELGPKAISTLSEYFNRINKTPIVKHIDGYTKIRPSPNLSGYFPLEGYDYDNDGKLDYVKQYLHGAPRIPFGFWHEVNKSDYLFKELQKEYSENISNR